MCRRTCRFPQTKNKAIQPACPHYVPTIATGVSLAHTSRPVSVGRNSGIPRSFFHPIHIIQPEDFDPRSGDENIVVVAGISSAYRKYKYSYVQLPYDASKSAGRPQTRLHSDVAVIIGWYHIISIDDDRCYWGGDVPAGIMGQINQTVREDIDKRLAQDATFLMQLRKLLRA